MLESFTPYTTGARADDQFQIIGTSGTVFAAHSAPVADPSGLVAGFADARAYASALLEATGVAVTPGGDFDPVEGSHCVRLSLAAGPEAIAEALERIIAWQDSRRSTGARG